MSGVASPVIIDDDHACLSESLTELGWIAGAANNAGGPWSQPFAARRVRNLIGAVDDSAAGSARRSFEASACDFARPALKQSDVKVSGDGEIEP